ncbi:MAG: hypothetical protein GXO25_00880 [Euryarchaeota archaeon]|nr:hypothetical protein [Euryarchaeota archaeon]
MDVRIDTLPNDVRFEAKLQIELYKLAERVMDPNKKEKYEEYMLERKEKLRKILNMEKGKIYEGDELIFEL